MMLTMAYSVVIPSRPRINNNKYSWNLQSLTMERPPTTTTATTTTTVDDHFAMFTDFPSFGEMEALPQPMQPPMETEVQSPMSTVVPVSSGPTTTSFVVSGDSDYTLPIIEHQQQPKQQPKQQQHQQHDEEEALVPFSLSRTKLLQNEFYQSKKRSVVKVRETGYDSMRTYIKSMCNHELLNKNEEVILAREIQILVSWEDTRTQLESQLLRYDLSSCCVYIVYCSHLDVY